MNLQQLPTVFARIPVQEYHLASAVWDILSPRWML
jgi:hypothetical protein